MTVTAAPRYTRASKINLLYSVASKELVERGETKISKVMMWFYYGLENSRPEHAKVLSDNAHAFRDDTGEESCALYELVLNLLEQEYGPLICDPGEANANVWGYAEQLDHLPRHSRDHVTMFDEIGHLWRRRVLALEAGHPDQDSYDHGMHPNTTWRLAAAAPLEVLTKKK